MLESNKPDTTKKSHKRDQYGCFTDFQAGGDRDAHRGVLPDPPESGARRTGYGAVFDGCGVRADYSCGKDRGVVR